MRKGRKGLYTWAIRIQDLKQVLEIEIEEEISSCELASGIYMFSLM
jgi:hypothetical protein